MALNKARDQKNRNDSEWPCGDPVQSSGFGIGAGHPKVVECKRPDSGGPHCLQKTPAGKPCFSRFHIQFFPLG